eukprot:13080214-Heterocapsa_arctica.AAC.1
MLGLRVVPSALQQLWPSSLSSIPGPLPGSVPFWVIQGIFGLGVVPSALQQLWPSSFSSIPGPPRSSRSR